MNLKRNIRIFAGIIGSVMLIVAQIFNLTEGNLNTKQIVGAYLSIFVAVCVFASIIPDIIKKKKMDSGSPEMLSQTWKGKMHKKSEDKNAIFLSKHISEIL